MDDGSGEDGPKTAPLRHEMNYYQITNLKIIKGDKNETNSLPASMTPQAKNTSEIKLTVTRQNEGGGGKDKLRNKVYSQVI